ncbi:MFS transporter [Streptomyces bohaiensis]|uniref:Multidrug efflux pump Tap n=1 Tax=Streptomyces bohaiensis TaxID=1431344 RepID=A0ABX1CCP3_9ACTN|nr:MFS transporter [Streptomyces bohaiensis]NJQ15475.1 MFS transporter [Streptomyces bohaiensis]
MNIVPFAYLSSYLLSLLGNSIAAIALPLIVLQTTGSVLGAGAVAAATAVPAFAAGLLMGVVIDRINRRTSSVVTDLVSAAALAALPVVDRFFGLTLGWFILCGIIGSLGDVPGITARETLLPAVVRHGGVPAERLVGIREALGAVGLLLGPAAAGTLMVLLDGSTVLWITAGTSLAAALLTLLIPHRVGATGPAGDGTPPRGSGWAQLRDGWRALLGSRFLTATTLIGLASALVLASMQGLVLPVWFSVAGQPGMLGFVLTSLAAGMLLGGAAYAAFGTRGPRRAWFLAGLLGSTAGFGLIAGLWSTPVVLAGAVVAGIAGGLSGGLLGVLMIERIPERLRGRILGTQNALMTAALPGGIVAAALLTEYAGIRVAALSVAALWLPALAVGLLAEPLRNLEPESGTEPAREVVTEGA